VSPEVHGIARDWTIRDGPKPVLKWARSRPTTEERTWALIGMAESAWTCNAAEILSVMYNNAELSRSRFRTYLRLNAANLLLLAGFAINRTTLRGAADFTHRLTVKGGSCNDPPVQPDLPSLGATGRYLWRCRAEARDPKRRQCSIGHCGEWSSDAHAGPRSTVLSDPILSAEDAQT
jgi:hypothetical protein